MPHAIALLLLTISQYWYCITLSIIRVNVSSFALKKQTAPAISLVFIRIVLALLLETVFGLSKLMLAH
jgi:hypothetical protein